MNQALQIGPQGSPEEADRIKELVENYMKKNTELYDIETLIPVSDISQLSPKLIYGRYKIRMKKSFCLVLPPKQDVIKCLHRNSSIAPYMACNEKIVVPFVREVLRVAWAMLSLDPPIDLPAALEGDVINERRYRRTYDSEFSATSIDYFVWPALVRDRKVVAKGEVVTRRILPQKAKKVFRKQQKLQKNFPNY